MTISVDEMWRQVVRYGLEAQRNTGLEEAAGLAERHGRGGYNLAADIRAMKRDPSAQMTDWWAKDPICDFAPMGA